jgi:pyridoxine/pyridoxamine 5'-phosphate oxidase
VDSPGKKFARLQLNGKKLGMVARLQMGGLQSRLAWAKSETLFKKLPKQKELEAWLKKQSTCLANLKP